MKKVLTFLALLTPFLGMAQYGVLDNSFDGDGVFLHGEGLAFGQSVAQQADGKLILFGTGTGLVPPLTAQVIRLNPDGT